MKRIAGTHDTLTSSTCFLFFIGLVDCDEIMPTLEFLSFFFFSLVIEFYLKYIGFQGSSIVPYLFVHGSYSQCDAFFAFLLLFFFFEVWGMGGWKREFFLYCYFVFD